jgi:hypothetical protein
LEQASDENAYLSKLREILQQIKNVDQVIQRYGQLEEADQEVVKSIQRSFAQIGEARNLR